MRFIIYGAGAVGGVIGARLFEAGHQVVLIARGAHLEAIRHQGLCFKSPGQERLLPIPAAGHPREIEFAPGDVVVMATKTQDSPEALDALLEVAGPAIPLVCAQNGVANERLAATRGFENVYGMLVVLPATHLEPGTVRADTGPVTGLLDVGRYPEGKDRTISAVARALEGATFRAKARDRIMPWKYAKLLSNLGNALQAACGLEADTREVARQLRAEALACYRAAGIACTSEWNMRRRRVAMVAVNTAAGGGRGWDRLGGSTWQSLQRGANTLETDYLNGEIVELGRAHGVATPANAALQRIAARLVSERRPPGSMTVEELRSEIEGWRT